jgi:UDP-N-acetylglucosamine 1-carboxyvinyltransferase
MGAKINGAGTSQIVVEGVAKLGGARHRVLPDRIETGTYAMAVAMTGGDVMLENARAELLQEGLNVLAEAGLEYNETNRGLRVARNGGALKAVEVTTQPFPGFPTDLQAQLMALMTRASGTSRITETIFDKLKGAPVMATDLRASVSLVIAALAAEGETMVNRVYHLDRGFERLEDKLSACGADIERIVG